MIVNCPNCGKQLKLGEKITESVRQLEPGRRIKIKCAHCSTPFGLDRSMDQAAPARSGRGAAAVAGSRVKPPAPPDTQWLQDGTFVEREVIEDIPRALVLMPEMPGRDHVVKAAAGVGYRVELADRPAEAIEKMMFVNYAAVFLHSRFEGDTPIGSSSFHQFMRAMNMSRRRYIFYVLLGEQFKTLYDLQALTSSANLVVGDLDLPFIGMVLKKAIPEYEALFGPLMEELRLAGK